MLTLYRRHRAGCRFKSRRAKCFCPIWAQGILRGEKIRKSLDLTNWEAAQKLCRDWEIDGRKEIPSVREALTRFVADQKSRGPRWSRSTRTKVREYRFRESTRRFRSKQGVLPHIQMSRPKSKSPKLFRNCLNSLSVRVGMGLLLT
jgi:hypothetical protein